MSGSFGYIIQQTDRIKKFPHSRQRQGRHMKAFENEIRIYHILDQVHPPLKCIPHFYGSGDALQMQKIVPSLQSLQGGAKFFHDSFACLDRLHQYILHMDLSSTNIGYRSAEKTIVFFDFGNSVTIHDLKQKAGVTDRHIAIFRQHEMESLYDILLQYFPEKQKIIDRAFAPYKKTWQILGRTRTEMKEHVQDKAYQIVFA